MNKSEAIRQYATANPSATPKEIAEALTGKNRGQKFTNSLVSTTLYQEKKKGRLKPETPEQEQKRLRKKLAKQQTQQAKQQPSDNHIYTALAFVKEVGGLHEASSLLETLEEIADEVGE